MPERTPIRVLLVEDEPADAALVASLLDDPLTDHISVDHIDCLAPLHHHLKAPTQPPNAILLDLSLPESRGLATLRPVLEAADGLPIVVLTGLMDDAVGLRAIEQGAQDYLRKDQLDGPLLARALRFAVERSRSRAMLESVLRSQTDALLVVEPDGAVQLRTPAARHLFGRAPTRWNITVAGESPAADDLAKAAAGGHVLRRTFTIDGPSGDAIDLDVRIGPLGAPSGGGLVVIRDVTDELDRRRHVERLNDMLREHLAHKTALLDRLEVADRERGRFIDAVSHELRTPLTPVLGFSNLLLTNRRDPLSEGQRSAVEAVHRSALRLERIVEGMFDLRALENTFEPLTPSPVDVRRLMGSWAREARRRLSARPIEVGVSSDPDLPRSLLLEQHRLTKALLRVLDNAVRFTRTGRIDLSAAWRNGVLQLTVADTGVGIAPEHTGSIFTAFYQVNPGSSGQTGGLGLAHARALVRSMQGDIGVVSTPGAGSRFTISLPAEVETS